MVARLELSMDVDQYVQSVEERISVTILLSFIVNFQISRNYDFKGRSSHHLTFANYIIYLIIDNNYYKIIFIIIT